MFVQSAEQRGRRWRQWSEPGDDKSRFTQVDESNAHYCKSNKTFTSNKIFINTPVWQNVNMYKVFISPAPNAVSHPPLLCFTQAQHHNQG